MSENGFGVCFYQVLNVHFRILFFENKTENYLVSGEGAFQRGQHIFVLVFFQLFFVEKISVFLSAAEVQLEVEAPSGVVLSVLVFLQKANKGCDSGSCGHHDNFSGFLFGETEAGVSDAHLQRVWQRLLQALEVLACQSFVDVIVYHVFFHCTGQTNHCRVVIAARYCE